MIKVLRILKSPDPLMWYSKFIGKTVPYEGEWRDTPDCYRSREPAGYSNIVKKDDAILIEVEDF